MLTREDLQAINDLLTPKFDVIIKRLDYVENHMEELSTRMGTLEGRTEELSNRIGTLENQMSTVESRMDSLEMRMDRMESDISALKYGQIDIRKDIMRLSDRINDVCNLALNNFGQIEESKMRLNHLEHRA